MRNTLLRLTVLLLILAEACHYYHGSFRHPAAPIADGQCSSMTAVYLTLEHMGFGYAGQGTDADGKVTVLFTSREGPWVEVSTTYDTLPAVCTYKMGDNWSWAMQ